MGLRRTSLEWFGWEMYELPVEFVEEMTDETNLAYAKAIIVCAAGDGDISERERAWLVGYLVSAGDSDAVIDEIRTYTGDDDLQDLINSSEYMSLTARPMLYDALRACSADGELSEGERARIADAASRLGVPAEVVAELEEIVQEEAKLRKRRHQLIVLDTLAAAGR